MPCMHPSCWRRVCEQIIPDNFLNRLPFILIILRNNLLVYQSITWTISFHEDKFRNSSTT